MCSLYLKIRIVFKEMQQVIQFNFTREKRLHLSQLTMVYISQYDPAPALTAKFIQYHISSHSSYSSNTAFIPLVQASVFSHSLSPSPLLLALSFSSSCPHSLFLHPPELFFPQITWQTSDHELLQ